jgi:hypothetical protein
MEVLAKPDSASVVVDKINEGEVHLGLWFLNKAGTLHRSDSLLPCTVSGHEPQFQEGVPVGLVQPDYFSPAAAPGGADHWRV